MACALDIVGERWALLVVRELLFGPKRFTDLQSGLRRVSPDVLAQRLRELEQAGVVRRGKLPPPAGARVYELTSRGQELEPVILALGRWGSTAPGPPGDARISADSLALGLKTLFDPVAADGFDVSLELRLGDQRFRARIADGLIDVIRGEADRPAAVIATDPGTLAAVMWGGRPITEAQRSGDLEIQGSGAAVRRFVDLFPLPPAA